MIVPLGQNCMVAEVCRRWGLEDQIVRSPVSYALSSIEGTARLIQNLDALSDPATYKRSTTREGVALPTLPEYRICLPHHVGDEWCANELARVRTYMVERAADLRAALNRDSLTFSVTMTDEHDISPLLAVIEHMANGRDWRVVRFGPLPTNYVWHQRHDYETERGVAIERDMVWRLFGTKPAAPVFLV